MPVQQTRTRKPSATRRGLFGLAAAALAPAAMATMMSTGQINNFGGATIDPYLMTGSTEVAIGQTQPGTITVNNDPFTGNGITSVFTERMSVGDDPGVTGQLNITGFGASWNQDNTYNAQVFLGYEGQGELNISNGGRLTSLGPAYLGGSSDRYSSTGNGGGTGVGVANISGTGTQWVIEELHVGASTNSQGTVNVTNGGQINNLNNWVYVGYHANSTGTLIVDGDTSVQSNVLGMTIARSGRGTLEIRNGGKVTGTTSNYDTAIGFNNGSLGRVIVTGDGSRWEDSNQDLFVGSAGTGSLEIGRGAVVSFGRDVIVGKDATGRGQLIFEIGDDGNGQLKSGRLDVGGNLDIGSGFGLFAINVDADARKTIYFGDSFVLADYNTFSGDNFLKTDLGVTAYLADGGTVISPNGVQFVIDYNANLDGQGDLGITATVLKFMGDTDGDGDVDDADLGAAFAAYTGPGGSQASTPGADIDGDGDIDDADLGALFAYYTGPLDYSSAAPAISAVPEPGSLALLTLGGLLIARRRRG